MKTDILKLYSSSLYTLQNVTPIQDNMFGCANNASAKYMN